MNRQVRVSSQESGKTNNNALWNISFIFLILVSLITAMGFNMVYVMISKYAMNCWRQYICQLQLYGNVFYMCRYNDNINDIF